MFQYVSLALAIIAALGSAMFPSASAHDPFRARTTPPGMRQKKSPLQALED